MKNPKRVSAIIATLVLTLLMASSPFLVFSNSAAPTGVATEAGLGGDYGDIMQYDWPMLGHDESYTRFSAGPAPNKPDLLWRAPGTIQAVFNGKAFAIGGFGATTTLYCLDAFTGEQKWRKVLGTRGGSAVTKLNDEYLLVDASAGLACYKILDGAEVWFVPTDFATKNVPASGNYFPGRYSSELKMKYILNYSRTTKEAKLLAFNLSDPSKAPTISWSYIVDEPAEVLCVGGGKVFMGGYQYHMYAFDGKNGTLLWKSTKIGLAAYSATYTDGKLYHSCGSTRLTCYEGDTGEILWDYDAGAGRAFFAYGGATAYGRYYQHNIDPYGGFVACWHIQTGDVLWRAEPAYYYLGYFTPAVADGKLFVTVSDGQVVVGKRNPPANFTCFDAFSGVRLWSLPFTVTYPIIAYGNLYAETYCIGPSKPPKPWSYFRGNTDTPGLAVGQSGPAKLNVKWMYKTGEAVTSSPAVVDGKVYIGSNDQNLYCLDAYTGEKIWSFKTEYRIASSPAVVGGRVYIGPDDGYIYCLDAKTGEQKWKVNLYGGNVPTYLWEVATWQARSSPVVIGDRLWVGALDGKVYCLETSSGRSQWTYQTGGPIGGSPAYSNGVIYIASTDRYVYALDAANGALKWKWQTPRTFEPIAGTVFGKSALFLVGTPTVAEGKVFIGGGAAYSGAMMAPSIIVVALNANNGSLVWTHTMPATANNQPCWTPTYFKGLIYAPRWMSIAAYNATNGVVKYEQWLGHQVFSSVAIADDIRGAKIYVGADSYSITYLNATLYPLSVYGTDGQVPGSPAIYDGKVYVGSVDNNVYCFDDTPTISMSIFASLSKDTVNKADSVIVTGKLKPEIPNAPIKVSFGKPDGTVEDVSDTTDNYGGFDLTYTPTLAGKWNVTAWYEGGEYPSHSYTYAYSDLLYLTVVAPTTPPTTTPTPTPTPTPTTQAAAIPTELVYVGAAIVAIVIVVAAGYLLMKRRKK